MKKISAGVILLIIFFMWGCSGTPESPPATAKELMIREVSAIPGFTKAQIFEKAKIWVATAYSSALDVIQYSNRPRGIVVGKTFIPHSRPAKFKDDTFEFRFTVIVECKDNKVRTTFKDFALYGQYGNETILKSDMDVIRPEIEKSIKSFVASFKTEKEKNDW